jgi:hypothetical protein
LLQFISPETRVDIRVILVRTADEAAMNSSHELSEFPDQWLHHNVQRLFAVTYPVSAATDFIADGLIACEC